MLKVTKHSCQKLEKWEINGPKWDERDNKYGIIKNQTGVCIFVHFVQQFFYKQWFD